MKATIHFTEKEVLILSDEEQKKGDKVIHKTLMDKITLCPDEYGSTQEHWYKVIAELPLTPELQKLLLLAVIEKEAEEKYPKSNHITADTVRQDQRRRDYIETWQSIIERLPSEDSYEKATNEVKAGVRFVLSKLLPSLPNTANCEVEITEGKIEVKSIKI